MASVSDITKLLELIPLWKELKTLPARVKFLEDKLAQLESMPEGEQCPYCKKNTLKLLSVDKDPVFGDLGGQVRNYQCSNCQKIYSENIDPSE